MMCPICNREFDEGCKNCGYYLACIASPDPDYDEEDE